MVPYLQPCGQVMVDLKLCFQSDLLKVTKVWLLTVALFCFCFSPPSALFFVIDYTTKLGMKDLLKVQQWWVERDSNLIPPQYRPNALTTTPCSPWERFEPDTAPVQAECSNHYAIYSSKIHRGLSYLDQKQSSCRLRSLVPFASLRYC